jgi:predicted HicB family RNase H-like nuclease
MVALAFPWEEIDMTTKAKERKADAGTIQARAAKALKIAREVFDRSTDWIEFSNALFGIGAPFEQLFPTQAERQAFMHTEAHRHIEEMLEKLQGGRDDEPLPIPGVEKQARFVLRLPHSMFEALKAEAQAEGVSINMLCVAKLGRRLREGLFLKC